MANKFTVGGDVVLTAKNVKQVAQQIHKSLSGVKGKIDITVAKNSATNIANLRKSVDQLTGSLTSLTPTANAAAIALARLEKVGGMLNKTGKNIQSASNSIANVNGNAATATANVQNLATATNRLGKSVKTLSNFAIAGTLVFGFIAATKEGTKEAIRFNDSIIDIGTTTGRLRSFLTPLKADIRAVGKAFGVSTTDLAESALTFSQAGLSARDTAIAVKALAKTKLSPSFGDSKNTTEAMIAMFGQFNVAATEVEAKLGSINAVSKRYATESSDLATVIRKAGGAYKQAGGSLEELLGLFTVVRSRTRESGTTIATSIKTLSGRLQSPDRIKRLEELTGVSLQEGGKFVGVTKAVNLLAEALAKLPDGSLQKAVAIQEIAGTHHLSRISVLLNNMGEAADITKTALAGTNSLQADAERAAEKLGVRLEKTKQGFGDFFDVLTDSGGFKSLTSGVLGFADGVSTLGKTLIPLLPALTAFLAVKAGGALGVGNPFGTRGRLIGGGIVGAGTLGFSIANSEANRNTVGGASFSGGVSGAATGAVLGSAGGIYGAAAGGLIGGGIGLVTSLEALDKRLAQIRLDSALESTASAASKLTNSLSISAGSITGDIEAQFLENAKRLNQFLDESRGNSAGNRSEVTARGVFDRAGAIAGGFLEATGPTKSLERFEKTQNLLEQKQSAREQLQPLTEQAGLRQTVFKGLAGQSTNVGDLEKSRVGGIAIEQEIRARQLERIEIAKETLSLAERVKVGADVRAEVLAEVRAMEKSRMTRAKVVKEINAFDVGFERQISGIENLKATLGDLSEGGGTKFGQSTSRFGASGFDRVVGKSTLGDGNRAFSILERTLPAILNANSLTTTVEDGQVEAVGVDSLRDKVLKALESGGIKFGSASALAISKKLDELDADPNKIAGLKDSPKALQDFLLGDLDKLRATFSDLASAFDSANDRLLGNLSTFAATTERIGGLRSGVAERQLDFARFQISRNGRADNSGLFAAAGQGNFVAEQKRITGLPANQALNPKALLEQARIANAGAENSRKQFAATGNPAFALQMKTFEQASINAVRGLERLADSTNRVTDLQNRLAAIERDENSRLNSTEKFINASPREKRQIIRDNALLQRASKEGFGKFNERDKVAALRATDFLGGDTALPGGKGTVADLRKALLTQEAQRLGLNNPAGGVEKKNVEQQIAEVMNNGINAQKALLNREQQLQMEFFRNLAMEHARFLTAMGGQFGVQHKPGVGLGMPAANAIQQLPLNPGKPLGAIEQMPFNAAEQKPGPAFEFMNRPRPINRMEKREAFEMERERRKEAFQQGKRDRKEAFENRGGGNPIANPIDPNMQQVAEKVERLAKAVEAMPHQIQMTGQQTIEHIFNGAEMLTKIAPALKELAEKTISEKLRKVFPENPDAQNA